MKEGWKEVRLGEVCFPTNNINWKNNTNSFKYIDLTSVSISEHKVSEALVLIDSNNAPSRAKQIVKNGDILFGTTRPTLCRYCLITPELDNQICSTGFCVLRPNTKDILSKYLFYVFSFHEIYSYLEPLQKGANYPAVTNKNVFDYTFPLPPLPEQQRIVSVLDSAFAKIEQMKHNAEKALLDAQDVFKNNLDDMMKMKEGWEEKIFSNIFKLTSGDALPLKKQFPGTFPVYGGNGVTGNHNEYNKDGKFIVIGRVGANCGNVRYIEGKFWLTDNAFCTQIDENIFTYKFIYYLLNQIQLGQYARQAAQPVISNSSLKHISIPLPPLSEQLRIVSVLDDLSAKCKQLESNYQRIIADCEEMKQAILTRAMNGEL